MPNMLLDVTDIYQHLKIDLLDAIITSVPKYYAECGIYLSYPDVDIFWTFIKYIKLKETNC